MISSDDLRRLANFTGSSPEMMRVRLHEAADSIYSLVKRINELETTETELRKQIAELEAELADLQADRAWE